MKNTKHPSFIIGVVSIILFIVGAATKSFGYRFADYIVIFSVVLGGIHWIWSIIDVSKTDTLEGSQKVVWLIAVIAIPLGGMIYYILHSKRNTIVD